MTIPVRSYQLSLTIALQFTLLQPKIAQKHKILYFLSLRSCKVINVDTISKHVTTACYDNIAHKYKDLADIFNRSKAIAHFVPNFVAIATREGRGKISLAAFDGPIPKISQYTQRSRKYL